MASHAARSKPSRELVGIKRQLQALTDNVLSGEVERADAAVCGQLLNVKLRATEIERKAKETEELEALRSEGAYGLLLNMLEERLPRDEFERAVRALSTPLGVIDM